MTKEVEAIYDKLAKTRLQELDIRFFNALITAFANVGNLERTNAVWEYISKKGD